MRKSGKSTSQRNDSTKNVLICAANHH